MKKQTAALALFFTLTSCSISLRSQNNSSPLSVSYKEIPAIMEANEVLSSIKIAYAEARLAEKTLLLRNAPEYKEKFVQKADVLLEQLHVYKEIAGDDSSMIDSTITVAKEYRTAFFNLIDQKMILGFTHTSGLTFGLRKAAYELTKVIYSCTDIETASGNAEVIRMLKLKNRLLTIRRYEKDYLLRNDEKYISRLQEQCDTLAQLLNDRSEDKRGGSLQIINYRKALTDYYDQQEQITKSMEQLRSKIHILEPQIHNLYKENYYHRIEKKLNNAL